MLRRCGLLLCVLAAAGCLPNYPFIKLPGMPSPEELQTESRQAGRHRERFRESQDPAAIRWLLANRIRTGLTLAEVNRELGLDGERKYEDSRFKARNIGVQRTDETWEWGPDKDGTTYVLFFRNDRLVNFEPSQFGDAH